MGMEWDPDGDAAARRENRGRWWLTIAIVLMVVGFIAKQLVQRHQRQQAEEELQMTRDFEAGRLGS